MIRLQLPEAGWRLAPFVVKMEHVFLSLLFCAIMVFVDWALVDGFRTSIISFRSLPENYNYKHFFYPRIFLILFCGILLHASSQTELFDDYSDVVSFISILLFIVSALYPQVMMYFKSEK